MDVNAFLKRGLDVTASGLGLLILSPVFVSIAAAIKLHDGGPVFYRAARAGQYGKAFKLYKFRSMVVNADQIGPGITGVNDARITPVGRFLRRTKLDELPQLWNVLKGEMSLVGPRPEDPKYVTLYTEEQRRVLKVRPGITSPASVVFRSEEEVLETDGWENVYITKIMPAKLAIDLEYVQNPNLASDIIIILKTLRALVSPDASKQVQRE